MGAGCHVICEKPLTGWFGDSAEPDMAKKVMEQLEQLRRQMETMQQQARQLIEETNRRCQQQIEQKEAEADQRVENARQNALDLFGKIDEEYRFNRRKYADMVQAINELSKYIEEAQRHANERIAALPESLIGKDRHE